MLRDEAAAILSYVTDRPEVAPHRVAEMLFRTRVARRHRAVAMVTGRDDLATALRAVAEGTAHPAVVRNAGAATPRKRAFVFPGQGGQRPGMGKLYYEHSPAFRAEADRCDEIFHELFGESPLTYVLDEDFPADDSARIVQPALFLQMAAFAAMWRAAGIEPDVTIGHSQGEIAAAYVSGKMTLADAILVVGTRAHAVDEIASDDYAMAVVAADRDECEDLLARRSGWAQLSVVNAPHMVGISGDRGTVQDVVDTLTERGTFARVIRVRYPAHTSAINRLGDDVREAVRSRLSSRHFHETKIECIGATLGRPITSDLPVDEYWFWNLRNVVRFDKAIAAAVAQQVDTFVELAEHPTLQLSIQENLSVVAAEHNTTVTGTSSRTATDLSEFARNLAVLATSDADYSWDRLRTGSEKTIPLPLPDFPNVRMNELRLWLPYNSPSAVRAGPVTPPAEHAAASSVTEHVPGNLADAVAPAQLLVEDWVRLVRRSLVPPRRLGLIDHTGACAELASALCAEAENYGATARMIDIENDDDSGDVDTVVVLLADPGPLDDYDAVARTADFFGLRSWWPGLGSEVTDCWLLTAGGETVVAEDAPPHPVHAAASAGFRCIGAEYPGVAFRHLDLSPEQARPDAAGAIIAAIHTAGEPELAVRGDSLYAKRLVEAERMTPDSAATAPENVVIIGGTGNLGLEFCDHFSRHGARRITLVGRSGETAATADRLARIRRTGAADIRTIRCDVRDKSAVARMAEELRATPADLIIHAAVDYSDIELAQITSEKADQALRTKVLGIAQALEVLPRAENCRVLLCSSMAATIGGRGQVVYAAANRMLDAMAHRLRAEGLDCVSVQWGQWTVHLDLGAAGAAKLAGAGVVPMDPADAIALGSNGIRTNAIVAAFDWSRARSALEAYGYGPLLSQLAATPADADHAPDGGEDLPRRMVKLLAEVIGVDRVGTIDTSVPMVAIGLDSLQALEFRRRVNGEFGHDLPVAQLLGGASVDDVVALVRSHPPIPARTGTPARPSSSPRPDVPAESVRPARPAQATKPVDITERARLAAAQAVPADLDHDRMRSARADLDTFGLRAMMETLDPVLRDGAVHTADEIAVRLEFAPRHRWLLQRWLDELTTHGYLDHAPAHGYRAAGPVPTPARSDLLTVCADLGYSPEFATFLQRSDEHLTELAQDRVRVQELLFPDGDMLTAEAAYRDNIISSYLNTAARETVAGIAERLERDRSPIRILELGAGIGGTTNDVLAGLSGLSVDYHFTDLSTFFLAAAQKRFAEYPWIRYGIMDLNTDLGEQPPYDIVIAANVVHNAHHIGKTLRQLHDLLNPGGAVVFIEACRANFQLLTSMKFLMSAGPGQPHPGSSDIRAGARIFLTEDEWRDQLSESGFTPMLVLPDADHPMYMLDQRIFAAVRD
ncbi:nocobactin polyketide synthase NbtC [Nocardia asiatica]|uniref:nocobactin polyketide synthase NbtC n=1 Tax=Nocardia asiatica TaxID=209252 RepID=UPI003CC7D36C